MESRVENVFCPLSLGEENTEEVGGQVSSHVDQADLTTIIDNSFSDRSDLEGYNESRIITTAERIRVNKLIRQYVKPNYRVREKAELFHRRNMVGFTVLGVQVRATDHWMEAKDHKLPSMTSWVERAQEILKTLRKPRKIFIASDNNEVIQKFVGVFGKETAEDELSSETFLSRSAILQLLLMTAFTLIGWEVWFYFNEVPAQRSTSKTDVMHNLEPRVLSSVRLLHRYHQFLDVNSQKVERNIDGVCQKLKVHSQLEKADILQELCDKFLNLPLTTQTQELIKTDAHYSLILLLLTLADSPTNVDYEPPPSEHSSEEEWFDWKSYLLDGEEEEILGLPVQHDQDWSDEEERTDPVNEVGSEMANAVIVIQDEDLDLTSDSGISIVERQLANDQEESQRSVEHNVRDREGIISPGDGEDRSRISDHIVSQYWENKSNNFTHTNTSEWNCSIAESWDSYQSGRNPFYHSGSNKTLTETQIVRDTLWMLAGAQNTFVYRHGQYGRITVQGHIQVLHLTPESLSSLLSSFALAGEESLSLQTFILSFVDPQSKPTQTLQAFVNALSGYFKVNLFLKIFLQTVEPCLRFIDEWVTSGHVHDPYDEFFIERIQSIAIDNESFWSDGVVLRCADQSLDTVVPCFLQDFVDQIFRAGKSVELIEGLGKIGKLHSFRTRGPLHQEFLDKLLSALSNNSKASKEVENSSGDETNLLKTITDSNQIMSVIEDTGDHVLKLAFVETEAPVNQRYSMRESSTADKLDRICSGICKLLKPVELLFSECLTPLLEDWCTQGSCFVVQLLKTDFCLLDHLAAMRNFFLLEAGDAMHQFYIEIFDKAPWPVSIIIDSSCQKLYNLVFLFLLKLKQAKWSLDELRFADLRSDRQQMKTDDADDENQTGDDAQRTGEGLGSPPPDQKLQHKMSVFRFKLMQFINWIHNHFMTRILHSTVLEFQEALDQAKDLDDLIKAHSSYVEKLYDRCLLSQKVGYLREVILKVLNLVLLFQTYWDRGTELINEQKFKKIEEEFTKCNTFLVSCLGNIAKRGAFPHLESLAFALGSS
ncbi:Gamma-tubulin complex component 5 [Stylophora pistillata]|uniref:Gamma-tubulin complex component n=1 Tax=Stylophora pistillata TaxID=50429 RepID=A0A2B4SGE3_STYPI|nr:Gamma-tubulin complex component 5 [Stylophora pistillata]